MQKLVNLFKTIVSLRVSWYVLGVITPVFVLFMLCISGVKPPLSHGEIVVSKWHILEQNENTLLVHILGHDNVCFMVGVERDPENGLVNEISVTNAKCENCVFRGKAKLTSEKQHLDQNDVTDDHEIYPVFPIFVCRTKGCYGVPMVWYGSNDPKTGLVWRDLNADNQFDQKIDYKNRQMEIYVSGRWIKGLLRDTAVTTDEGLFAFDPNGGRWRKIESGT